MRACYVLICTHSPVLDVQSHNPLYITLHNLAMFVGKNSDTFAEDPNCNYSDSAG